EAAPVAAANRVGRTLPGHYLAGAEFGFYTTRHSSGAGACARCMAGIAAYTSIGERDVMRRWTHPRTGKTGQWSHAETAGTAAMAGKHLALEQHAKQVRLRMQELGPAHSSFALYLASRLDVLPAEYCRELALTPDSCQALSPDHVHETISQELGAGLDR